MTIPAVMVDEGVTLGKNALAGLTDDVLVASTSSIGSLPALEYVNGLTREEFTAAALGFVKADNFSTNEVTVPAPGEQGFFIVAPQGK